MRPLSHFAPSPELEVCREIRILLAEDNEVNVKVAVRMLQKRGYHVTVARSGREAIEAHASGEFHVILMDVQMPELDGIEATQAIRQREAGEGRYTPIVALTAHASGSDRNRCLEAGMDDYISKPVRAEDLYEKIGALVGTPIRLD